MTQKDLITICGIISFTTITGLLLLRGGIDKYIATIPPKIQQIGVPIYITNHIHTVLVVPTNNTMPNIVTNPVTQP